MSATIPVTLLTGFLGAGKTTLLNALLRDPRLADTAVLINEFGETPVDNDLILEFSPDLIETTTGCICCTASSDVRQSLFDLWNRRRRREIRPFSRVIIETTGLADPAPVIHALTLSPGASIIDRTVATQFALSRTVTVVDAINGQGSVDEHLEALKQIALADVVVVSKSDLIPVGQIETFRNTIDAMIAEANPGAARFDRQQDFDDFVEALLTESSYDQRVRSADALAWLQAEAVLQAAPHTHDYSDRNRHGDGIRAHCITIDEPISPLIFNFFLRALQRSGGPSLLRVKGLFALSGDPDRPVVVHGVQHLVHAVDQLPRWPSDDRRTRVVLIGRDINIAAMKSILETRPETSKWRGSKRKQQQPASEPIGSVKE